MQGGGLHPLGDTGKSRAAAAGSGLDLAPGRACLEHGRDTLVTLRVLLTDPLEARGLGAGLTLHLTPAAIVVVITGNRREDVEQHTVDGLEDAPREFVGRRR